MTRRFPKTTTRREMRNYNVAYAAFASGSSTPPVFEEPKRRTGKTGTQKESKVNTEVKKWARMRQGVLYRNSKAMVTYDSGRRGKAGVGPNGMGDLIGYLSIQITPAMVGRTVAVFAMVESKRAPGVTASGRKDYGGRFDNEEQTKRIEEIRDAGGIAGYARSAVDAEIMLATWSARKL